MSKYGDLAERFRAHWNNHQSIKCWSDPADPSKEYAPFKELYSETDTDLKIREWYKSNNLGGWKLDYVLINPNNEYDYYLAAEFDGNEHLRAKNVQRDREKINALQKHGFIVLRYAAQTVYSNMDYVMDDILQVLHNEDLWGDSE